MPRGGPGWDRRIIWAETAILDAPSCAHGALPSTSLAVASAVDPQLCIAPPRSLFRIAAVRQPNPAVRHGLAQRSGDKPVDKI